MLRDLIDLLAVFVPFSLTSIGGGNAVMAGIQNQSVNVHHWLTAQEFINLFAISRASPGPGTMIASLIGWKVAGAAGAVVATVAFYLPSSLVCYLLVRATDGHRENRWYRAVRDGLAPVGTGLTIASLIALLRLAGGGPVVLGLCFGTGFLLLLAPRAPVLLLLGLGGLIGALALS